VKRWIRDARNGIDEDVKGNVVVENAKLARCDTSVPWACSKTFQASC
jgi:hypothetical protein